MTLCGDMWAAVIENYYSCYTLSRHWSQVLGLQGLHSMEDLVHTWTLSHAVMLEDVCLWVLSCSVVSDSFVTPWTVACQAPLSMGFLQVRILEWVATSSSRGPSQPRD